MLTPIYSERTDPGRERDTNQDYTHASLIPQADVSRPNRHLLAIADGVGGRDRGQWASRTAVAVLSAELPRLLETKEPKQALANAIGAANQSVWLEERNRVDMERTAATTLVAVLLEPERLWWANVGDSRAYLVRGRQAHPLTRDHSWVAEQVALGILTAEQARTTTQRNVITRAVGVSPQVEVDVSGPLPLQAGDVVVLCSDGLHGQVSDDEIAALAQWPVPSEATARLIALGNERGGPDNISVIVCLMQGEPIDPSDVGADTHERMAPQQPQVPPPLTLPSTPAELP